MHDAMISC